MQYKVVYGEEKKNEKSGRGFRLVAMTGGFLLLFMQAVAYFWPEGMALIRNLLPMRDAEQTIQAVEVFSQELGSGFSVLDAARNFCTTLLENGYSN